MDVLNAPVVKARRQIGRAPKYTPEYFMMMAKHIVDGPYGGVLAVTSEGGGGRLTRTATGWIAEILGKRKVLTHRARELMNLSTPQAIEITGSLGRSSRVVNSG